MPPIEKEGKNDEESVRPIKIKKLKAAQSKKAETIIEAVAVKKKTKKRPAGSFGSLTFPDSSVYEGQLKKGMPHG